MKIFRKTLITFSLLAATLMPVAFQTAYAQFTILPYAGNASGAYSMDTCKGLMNIYEAQIQPNINAVAGYTKEAVLGCAIKTGRISLNMIPYFISYFANFLLSLSGLICILFIVIGGYFYIYGGLTEQKEKGKKTIYHALLGMSLAILSWVIVNVIIAAVTS